MGKFTKICLGIVTSSIVSACYNPHCPPTKNASEQILGIELLNRKDTLHLGDSVIFQAETPMLPYHFAEATWDERARIIYSSSYGRLDTTNIDTSAVFMEHLFFGANIYDYKYKGPYTQYLQKDLTNGEFFRFGYLPKDTGNFWVSFYIPWGILFSDKHVPDYKRPCERNFEFRGNFSNLGQQPFMEHNQHPYREYLCVGNQCDTIVYVYGFRVEP